MSAGCRPPGLFHHMSRRRCSLPGCCRNSSLARLVRRGMSIASSTGAGEAFSIPWILRRKPSCSPRIDAACLSKRSWLEMTELERGERDRKRRTDLLVLASAIAAFLPAVYGMAKPLLTAAVLSAILAVAFNPLYSRMPNAARLRLFAGRGWRGRMDRISSCMIHRAAYTTN
jgi:hypothetical protein